MLSLSSYQFQLPELNKLAWVDAPAKGSGRFRQLAGWNGTPLSLPRLSPDGRWLAVEATTRINPEAVMSQDYDRALLVLDLQQSAHWLAAATQKLGHWYQWLADGRLLWIDQGQVFTALGDGSQKTNLNAPEPISKLWINDLGQALATGQHFWQVDLSAGHWQQIPGMGTVDDFSFSIDQTYGMAAVGLDEPYDPQRFYFPPAGGTVCVSEIWKVPAAPGSTAQRFPEARNAQHGWAEGCAQAPSQMQTNPRYWLAYSATRVGAGGVAYLLDEHTGQLVPADTVFNPSQMEIAYSSTSPDGQWVYLTGQSGRALVWEGDEANRLPLKLEDYEQVLGWLPDSSGLLTYMKDGETVRLRLHSVPPGEMRELAQIPPGWVSARLNGSWIELRRKPREALSEPTGLLLYDFQGRLAGQAAFPLDALNGPTFYPLGEQVGLLTGIQGQFEADFGACHFRTYIIQWNLAGPK